MPRGPLDSLRRCWRHRGEGSVGRCGHRSKGLPRQSGVVAAASSTRPCSHRGRQASCGNGMKLRSARKAVGTRNHQGTRGKGKEQPGAADKGADTQGTGRGGSLECERHSPTVETVNEEENNHVAAAIQASLVTHAHHDNLTSGLSRVPKTDQMKMLNAQLFSFLRVVVDVSDNGDCLFEALVHLWNAEVGGMSCHILVRLTSNFMCLLNRSGRNKIRRTCQTHSVYVTCAGRS